MAQIVIYGLGGYDPKKPNNNIIETREVSDDEAGIIPDNSAAVESAMSKLKKLGLTEEEISAIVNVS